jgi:FtsP/CotA-like multicopper oxidase with cupredoxin domain
VLICTDLYGSSWYHSHWSSQYGSGLYGPIVIYGPKNVQYDSDLGPVLLADYYHEYYTTAVEKTLANPSSGQAGPPLASNNLINGHPSTGGSGMATFKFVSGKKYRIRVVNTSAASVQRFSIDGYTFTVMANDFVPVQPYETDILVLSVGQRTDIIVHANGKPTDSVWMRAFRPPKCGPSQGGELVQAAIFYEKADMSQVPTTSPNANAYDNACPNVPLHKTVPYYPMQPPNPDFTGTVDIQFIDNGTALLWYMNGRTFRVDYNDPMLLEAKLGNLDFPEIRNVQDYGTNNSVRLVLENPGTQPHPMHLHGHNIWVLQEGICSGVPVSSAPTGPPPTASVTSVPPTKSGAPPSASVTSSAESSSHHAEPSSSPGEPTSSYSTYSSQPSAGKPSGPPQSKRELAVDYGIQEKRSSGAGCWDGTIANPSVSRTIVNFILGIY